MRLLTVLVLLFVAGCQTPEPVTTLPAPVTHRPAPASRIPAPHPMVAGQHPTPAPASLALEQKVRQQAQIIEALISQNDALTAKIGSNEPFPVTAVAPMTPQPVAPVPILAPAPPPAAAPAPVSPPELVLAPNSEGVIDLAAADTANPGEPVNPFTVRALPVEAVREVTLRVGGIIAGPVACAVINDRLVQSGESVESLAVERIDSGAVWLRHEGRRLRLPLSGKPVRVRLPL